MARDFNLDPEAAKQANTGGKRITETGAYSGKLRAAFYEKNEKGTESLNLMFEADNGQEIGPLPIYTHNGDGEALPGFNAVNALMTCMKVKTLKAARGKVELYDYDSQRVVTKEKDVYPELTGKAVGLVLRQEEYKKQNGDIGTRMIVAGSFDPTSRQMAGEILSPATTVHALDQMLVWLDKEPVKKLKGGSRAAPASSAAVAAGGDFVDDDIPF